MQALHQLSHQDWPSPSVCSSRSRCAILNFQAPDSRSGSDSRGGMVACLLAMPGSATALGLYMNELDLSNGLHAGAGGGRAWGTAA